MVMGSPAGSLGPGVHAWRPCHLLASGPCSACSQAGAHGLGPSRGLPVPYRAARPATWPGGLHLQAPTRVVAVGFRPPPSGRATLAGLLSLPAPAKGRVRPRGSATATFTAARRVPPVTSVVAMDRSPLDQPPISSDTTCGRTEWNCRMVATARRSAGGCQLKTLSLPGCAPTFLSSRY